ncbi:MAG TPA: hypothetical protein VE175_06500 [Woeseiaceae bacterium]|nr:hypothetical protein [Woeseiaceae bacterium]
MCALVQHPGHELAAQPDGRVCQTCRARIRQHMGGSRTAQHRARHPRGVPHREDVARCACEECRSARRRGVASYLRDLEALIAQVACTCVQSWPGAMQIVVPAEAELMALLLAWELDGVRRSLLQAEIREAERGLLSAWRVARDRYEVLDGRHGRG